MYLTIQTVYNLNKSEFQNSFGPEHLPAYSTGSVDCYARPCLLAQNKPSPSPPPPPLFSPQTRHTESPMFAVLSTLLNPPLVHF